VKSVDSLSGRRASLGLHLVVRSSACGSSRGAAPGAGGAWAGTVAAANNVVMASQMSSARLSAAVNSVCQIAAAASSSSSPIRFSRRPLILACCSLTLSRAVWRSSRALDVGLAGLAMALMVSNCLVAVFILLVKAAFMPRRVAALVGAMMTMIGWYRARYFHFLWFTPIGVSLSLAIT
jgi:hypothetical protein